MNTTPLDVLKWCVYARECRRVAGYELTSQETRKLLLAEAERFEAKADTASMDVPK